MTSVNNQPYAPQYRYETPPTPPSARSSDNPGAGTPNTAPDSPTPRPPVGAEQRGQFSSHNKIVNQQPQGAESKGELAELTQKNQNLLAKYKALIAKFSGKITELNTKIENLTQQLSPSAKQPEQAPTAPDAKPENRRADDQPVPPETSSTPDTQTQGAKTPDAEVTEQSSPQGVDKLAAEITQLHTAFKELLDNVNAAMKALTEKLEKLSQLLSESVPQKEAPAVQSNTTNTASSDQAEPETAAPPQNTESAPTDNSTAPTSSSVDRLKQENQKLEAQIDQMEAYFEQTMSTLEQQLETLTEKAREQKK